MTYIRPSDSYPKNWNRLRFAVFKEYNYRCARCQKYSKGDLHLHHIRPIGRGGSNYKENLIPLCSDCHYEVHFVLGPKNRWLK